MIHLRRLIGLTFSALLHAGAVLAILLVIPRTDLLPPLLVDLTESSVPSRDSASGDPPQPPRVARPAARPASSDGGRHAQAVPVARSRQTAAGPPAPAAPEPVEAPPPPPIPAPAPAVAAPPPVSPPAEPAAHGPETVATPSSNFPVGAATASGGDKRDDGRSPRDGEGGATSALSRSGLPGSTTGTGPAVALATPGLGSGGAGAEYGAYLRGLRHRVQAALRYPASARRQGLTGTVHLEMTIQPDGAIGPVSVLRSSAHTLLDEAALAAVRALRAEPLPTELPRRALRVRLPVVFELE